MTATFQAGGSFPTTTVTDATATGLQSVVFNDTGVQLRFLPVVMDHDRIRLNINARVSAIDDANFNETGNPSLQQGQSSSASSRSTNSATAVRSASSPSPNSSR